MSTKKRYLVLEDGSVLEGLAFGAESANQSIGEVVFSTNMAGFTQSATDPAYGGQIVVQTFPLVGNVGVNPTDIEASPKLKGYIVKELCQTPSHFLSQGTFGAFLMQQNIPGLCGIDTRALAKAIRNAGVLRGAITDDPAGVDMNAIKSYQIDGAVEYATVTEPASFPAENAKFNVTVWDFGVKQSDVRALGARGCSVTVMPAGSTAEQILATKPAGIFLSTGPGNPESYPAIAAEIKKVLGAGVAIFGYGLGHQLLAMACGGAIVRLPYGHRGGYSVYDVAGKRTETMMQNHGYAVAMDKLPPSAVASFTSVNDGSCEGLDYSSFNGFSIQFEPTKTEFDRYVTMMGGK